VDDKLPKSCSRMGSIAHTRTVQLLIGFGVPGEIVGQLSAEECSKVLLWAVRLDTSTKIIFLETWCALACFLHALNHILYLFAPMPPQLLHCYCDYLEAAATAADPRCAKLSATSCIDSASVWPNARQAEQQAFFVMLAMFMMFLLFFLSYLRLLLLLLLFLWLLLLFLLLLLLLLLSL
jgi:hypothetical protein